jgi:hypothetical protein
MVCWDFIGHFTGPPSSAITKTGVLLVVHFSGTFSRTSASLMRASSQVLIAGMMSA